MERTLVLFKPDAVKRSLVGEITSRFEKSGLKIIGIKMLSPSEEHFHHHYEGISKLISRTSEDVYKRNTEFMMSGPVIAMVLEGIDAVSQARRIIGDTNPSVAQPGTIRGDYAHMSFKHADEHKTSLPNLVHGSGNLEEAKQEVAHWFKEDELFDYKTAHQDLTQTQN